jgi:hypothetical protein
MSVTSNLYLSVEYRTILLSFPFSNEKTNKQAAGHHDGLSHEHHHHHVPGEKEMTMMLFIGLL